MQNTVWKEVRAQVSPRLVFRLGTTINSVSESFLRKEGRDDICGQPHNWTHGVGTAAVESDQFLSSSIRLLLVTKLSPQQFRYNSDL